MSLGVVPSGRPRLLLSYKWDTPASISRRDVTGALHVACARLTGSNCACTTASGATGVTLCVTSRKQTQLFWKLLLNVILFVRVACQASRTDPSVKWGSW